MAAIPYSVAEAFKNKKPARSGAFVSVGDGIYSYGMKLAQQRIANYRLDMECLTHDPGTCDGNQDNCEEADVSNDTEHDFMYDFVTEARKLR